jgi:hypothetical protein
MMCCDLKIRDILNWDFVVDCRIGYFGELCCGMSRIIDLKTKTL